MKFKNEHQLIQKVWELHTEIKNQSVNSVKGARGYFHRTSNGFFTVDFLDHFTVGKTDTNGNILWEVLAEGEFTVGYLRGIDEDSFMRITLNKNVEHYKFENLLKSKFLNLSTSLRVSSKRIPFASVMKLYTDGTHWLKVWPDGSMSLGRIGTEWTASLNTLGKVTLDEIIMEEFLIE